MLAETIVEYAWPLRPQKEQYESDEYRHIVLGVLRGKVVIPQKYTHQFCTETMLSSPGPSGCPVKTCSAVRQFQVSACIWEKFMLRSQ